MTIKELKEHCVRQITKFERIKEIMSITPNGYKHYEEHKMVLQLIEALEQQPSEDAVSREAVIDTSLNSKSSFKNDFACGFFIDKIRDLPPVTPKQKTGRWYIGGFHNDFLICPECGFDYTKVTRCYNYCPACGRRMVEPQEVRDKKNE